MSVPPNIASPSERAAQILVLIRAMTDEQKAAIRVRLKAQLASARTD